MNVDWTQVIINGGGVGMCFASLCYVLFLLGRMAIVTLGRPWLARHIAFMDSLESRLDAHDQGMRRLNNSLEAMCDSASARNDAIVGAIKEQTSQITASVNSSCRADILQYRQRPPKPS